MLITAHFLGVSEHDSSGKWVTDTESSLPERRSMFTHLRVDFRTDGLSALLKYVSPYVSFQELGKLKHKFSNNQY